MMKIMSGKLYGTDTSRPLAHATNGNPPASDEHAANTLYQTDDGRYFLYMFGGRKTTYARKVGPIPIAGEDIRPLTSKQAAKWARKHLTYREVKALFPDEKM